MNAVSRRKPFSPPEYHSLEYWSARFRTEKAFEWLGEGSASLLPALLPYLSETPVGPRLLHIGCGNSGLGIQLKHIWRERGWLAKSIINLDFVPEVVDMGREKEIKDDPEECPMLWECADLLDCSDIERIFYNALDGAFADFILDKSTADAISCGLDVCIAKSESPVYRGLHDFDSSTGKEYEPLELLLLHLAYLIRIGGYYLAMSYSSSRFEVLEKNSPAGDFWQLKDKIPIPEQRELNHAGGMRPQVLHFVYVLQRQDKVHDSP